MKSKIDKARTEAEKAIRIKEKNIGLLKERSRSKEEIMKEQESKQDIIRKIKEDHRLRVLESKVKL